MENRGCPDAGRGHGGNGGGNGKKLIDYLQEGVPALEVEYDNFLERVEEETVDPEWEIENHPAKKILERFPLEFGGWVNHLQEKLFLKTAGYPFDKDDLTMLEWKCLGILENHSKGGKHADHLPG